METQQVLQQLEQNLFLPSGLLSCEKSINQSRYKCTLTYGIIPDPSVLNCGCILSEKLFQELEKLLEGDELFCPLCHSCPVTMVGPVRPLRTLYEQLQFFKHDDEEAQRGLFDASNRKLSQEASSKLQRSSNPDVDDEDHDKGHPGMPKQSLISLFHSVASSFDDAKEEEIIEVHSLDNASNTKTVPIQDTGSVPVSLATTESLSSVQISDLDEEKEFYFAKCFPLYRKRSQFNTHNKFLRTKSRQFVNTAISPDCSKFALITEHKWEVYGIPHQLKKDGKQSKSERELKSRVSRKSQVKNDRSSQGEGVSLLFCGKSSGEYGDTFETLKLPVNLKSLYTPKQLQEMPTPPTKPPADSWEHLYCQMSEDLLIISGTKGRFRVFDLNCGGRPIYTYGSTFPIRCIDLDIKSSLIACGITGNDRTTGAEQALILFHQIIKEPSASTKGCSLDTVYKFLSPITTTLPYRDPVNNLQFSPDTNYISCSTALESRFLVISLRKIHEPRLVMKSLRSIDTSLESEGITDTKMFPGNSNLMCVTSVAFNAPPIVINTRIQSISVAQSVAQPTMLLRLDELGSKIHKCEISPRNDSIAFLDRNGNVSIMYAPTLFDNEKRRIVLVDVVANASRVRDAASLKFSADGHKLFILDRKGTLYIEDFASGLPQDQDVTKCKQIN
ncbi:LAFA_0C01508g1_1 [Lachancea sp. 'fantastica']|nr:LAFA_0C01508g1_1 [Lachancea sp. 'fantastica']